MGELDAAQFRHDYDLHGVAYGRETFVAVGDGGAILTFSRWLNLVGEAIPEPIKRLNKVAYGGGTFVTVGVNGILLISPDGEIWTSRSSRTGGWLDGIAYGRTSLCRGRGSHLTSRRSRLEQRE